MLKTIYKQLTEGNEVRQNLIALKKELKIDNNKIALMYHLAGDYHVFYDLLEHEDPKVRKNVALIMGELGDAEMMSRLFAAYEKEDKLFVKADYLVALGKFDYRPLLQKLKKSLL